MEPLFTRKSESSDIKLLIQDEILDDLLLSISKATKSIQIVGPWIDAYFVGKVIESLHDDTVDVSFVVRIDEDNTIDSKTLSALNLARKNIKNFQAKCLKKLHTKLILIDHEIFYLGSANWYWYSLHESVEITVTGDIKLMPDLIQLMYNYWKNSQNIPNEDLNGHNDFSPIKIDPFK
jgi:phosphatidylserine/phosphatidylglycerophosphate/cardiolipin synthase-like enzyme